MTVFENVQLPLLLNDIEDRQRVEEMIRRVGLEGKEREYPFRLSGGEQQRVATARALIHDPDIVLADEPTGSLDSRTGLMIMDLIRQLVEEQAKTVVLVTHEDFVARYARRRVAIKDGMLFEEGGL
jgi:putative ABC transport system ATP-binding protein